jgi:2-polyprenyl-6-methoxyphenol hydroxylase-like FAD-dependent oxidoreductase
MTAPYRYCVSLTIVSFPAYDGAMRIAVLGGGPGGLYFAALAKQLDARHDITVWERNAADDTFGFGVVFSDETLGGIEHADEEIFSAMRREFARWDDIDVHLGRARFRRDEPQAAAGHLAGPLRCARGASALPHRGS